MNEVYIDYGTLNSDQKNFLCQRIDQHNLDKQIINSLISYGFDFFGEIIPLSEDLLKKIPGLEHSYPILVNLMESKSLKLGKNLKGWSVLIAKEYEEGQINKQKIYKESDLVIPALYEIHINDGLTTTQHIMVPEDPSLQNRRRELISVIGSVEVSIS